MSPTNASAPLTIADFSVNTALPRPGGFTLRGTGKDGADYELRLDLDLPMSGQTQLALGEMLAQSEWQLSRIPSAPSLRSGARRIRQASRSS